MDGLITSMNYLLPEKHRSCVYIYICNDCAVLARTTVEGTCALTLPVDARRKCLLLPSRKVFYSQETYGKPISTPIYLTSAFKPLVIVTGRKDQIFGRVHVSRNKFNRNNVEFLHQSSRASQKLAQFFNAFPSLV